VVDSLYVIEIAMRHFFIGAEMGKNACRKKEEVDEDYKQAAALAALVGAYFMPWAMKTIARAKVPAIRLHWRILCASLENVGIF
jgi:hypothetical protein